jgi:hypothetical protein
MEIRKQLQPGTYYIQVYADKNLSSSALYTLQITAS